MRAVNNCFWVEFELSFGACRVKVFGFECDVYEQLRLKICQNQARIALKILI